MYIFVKPVLNASTVIIKQQLIFYAPVYLLHLKLRIDTEKNDVFRELARDESERNNHT